jgi:hypothetical protein
MATVQKQTSRSPGLSWQELLDTDTRQVPEILRLQSTARLGDHDLSNDRYIDPAYHAREVEKLWSRVWQFACREEHIPEVGDHIVYDIANLSFVVMRVAPNRSGFTTPARGRRLRTTPGAANHAHGFTWGWTALQACALHDWICVTDPAKFSPGAGVGPGPAS